MLQTLLADRFKLVVRRQTRPIPAYALTVAKGGSKLTAWKEGDPTTMREYLEKLGVPPEREFYQQLSAAGQTDRRWLTALKGSMSQLVNQIKVASDRPIVLDRTGITGEFNYRFFYSVLIPPSPNAANANPAATPTGPPLFSALEQELGLKLEAINAPTEVWVIDHVERPSEN